MNASFQFFRLLMHTSFDMRNMLLKVVESLQEPFHVLRRAILGNVVELCLKFHIPILERLDFFPIDVLTSIKLICGCSQISFELLNLVLQLLVLVFKLLALVLELLV